MNKRRKTAESRRLVVLSVDGMHPDFYRRASDFGLKIPNILRLVESGASADGVESIFPTTTYPAHTTLVTGVPPRAHGIYSHLASLDPTEAARRWHWFAAAIRVPTLWTAARATGLRTAAVSWPVSAGASIDYNLPEIWDPSAPDPHRDFETVARRESRGLFDEMAKALRLDPTRTPPDRLRGEAALHLWRNFHPNLLLVHFVGYDQQAHRHGPRSRAALTTLEQCDRQLGRIREAISGGDPVTLVVLSDHGFVPVEYECAPLVVFAEEALFDQSADGKPELRRLGAIHAGGSFAVYWLEEPRQEEKRALDRALRRVEETGAVAEVMDRAKLDSLEADPDAEFILDAAPGFYFSDRFEGPVVRHSVQDRGTHGHLPTHAGLEAGFIVSGPGIAPGKNLGRITLTRIGRSLAHLMGFAQNILAAEEEPLDLA